MSVGGMLSGQGPVTVGWSLGSTQLFGDKVAAQQFSVVLAQQLLPDQPGFVLAEGLVAAHRRQGDGGAGSQVLEQLSVQSTP